jgi:T5SS/PEP-CTERM-associated repeat protein
MNVGAGTGGAGTLHATNGATVTCGRLSLGSQTGASGTMEMSGAAALVVQNRLSIGGSSAADNSGAGSLTITGGSSVTAGDVVVGDGVSSANHSRGAFVVTEPGSSLTTSGNLYAGPASGTQTSCDLASMHIGNGATVRANVTLWGSFANDGQLSLVVDTGGQLLCTANALNTRNGFASILVDGPQSLLQGAVEMNLNQNGTGTATLTVRNGSHLIDLAPSGPHMLSVSGASPESGQAQILLTDPGTVVQGPRRIEVFSGLLTIANGAHVFSAKGASTTSSAGIVGLKALQVGKAVVTGTDSLWDCTNGHLVVGYGSNGPLQTGRLEIVNGGRVNCVNAYVARFGNSDGSVLLDGTASSWQVSGSLYIAGNESSAAGTVGNVTLNGTLSVGGDEYVGQSGTAVFMQTGGAHQVGGTLRVANFAGSNGSYTLGGGTLTASAVQINSGGTLQYESGTLATGAVALSGTGKLTLSAGGDKILRTGTLTIDVSGGSKVDLNDNDTLLSSTSYASTAGYIANARHGGAWDRPGMTSSAASTRPNHNTTLGVLRGDEYRSIYGVNAAFDGVPVSNSDTLVKYTWYGDTDFNGKVNFDDYVRTDSGFNNHLSGWLNGDFDLNGQVNFDDYVLIDLAFNTQSGTLRRAFSFLDGSNTESSDMNEPSLRRVQQHLAGFGSDYARAFIAAVPEPSVTAFAPFVLMALRRRRSR